jgi:hypothetical protein
MTVTPCTSRSSPGSSPRSASRTDSSTSLSQSSRSGILTCTTLFRDGDRDRSLSPHPSCAVLPPSPHLCSSLSSVLLSYDLLCRIVAFVGRETVSNSTLVIRRSTARTNKPWFPSYPPICLSSSPPFTSPAVSSLPLHSCLLSVQLADTKNQDSDKQKADDLAKLTFSHLRSSCSSTLEFLLRTKHLLRPLFPFSPAPVSPQRCLVRPNKCPDKSLLSSSPPPDILLYSCWLWLSFSLCLCLRRHGSPLQTRYSYQRC